MQKDQVKQWERNLDVCVSERVSEVGKNGSHIFVMGQSYDVNIHRSPLHIILSLLFSHNKCRHYANFRKCFVYWLDAFLCVLNRCKRF